MCVRTYNITISLWCSMLLFTSTTITNAFVFPTTTFVGSKQGTDAQSSSTTSLYISSWTSKGGGSGKWGDTALKNPQEKIQDYLKEPDSVEARNTIDGTVLVSGLVNAQERTDQFLFDLLNHEDSAYEFTKIIAYVNDAKFSKKRLLSRSARYTGLLDKIDFIQANIPNDLPTSSQLENVTNWVAILGANNDESNNEKLNKIQEIATIVKSVPSLQNVAILLMNAVDLDLSASQKALESIQNSGITYTIVVVGTIEERTEGNTFYHYKDFGTIDGIIPMNNVFSREESYRMITELLQLQSGANRALSFAEVYNINVTEAKLIKGLREAGYARPQEIDHMIRDGPQAYKKAIEEFVEKYPDAAKGYTTNAWWEAEIYQKSRRNSAERTAAQEQLVVDTRTMEIEEIAKEWGKREFFRQTMSGTVDSSMTEEEYTKSVWERAMFEADQKYRIMKGETIDEELELATFKSQQERKQLIMLQRAKEEMKEILQSDDDDNDNNDNNDNDTK